MAEVDAAKRLNAVASAITMIGPDHNGVKNDGHTVNAVRAADVMLKRAGLSWSDVGQALVQREMLLTAAKQLRVERDQALARVQELTKQNQANGGGFAQQMWQPAGLPASVENRHAQWVLDLAGQGHCRVSEKEEDFLKSCAKRSRLTDPMKDWLRDIIRRAAQTTDKRRHPEQIGGNRWPFHSRVSMTCSAAR